MTVQRALSRLETNGRSDAMAYLPLLQRLEAGVSVTEEHTRMVEEALAVWTRPGFDTLICRARLRFEPFPYQLRAATGALREMRGRAILADEVGLGKTIEAGLFLSELGPHLIAHLSEIDVERPYLFAP